MWFVAALAVAALSSLIAMRQRPRPDPYTTPALLSLDWWRYPVERNGFKRVPGTTSALNAVHALRGGDQVWVVGDGGLLVHSSDGGRTWKQDTVRIHRGEETTAGSTDSFMVRDTILKPADRSPAVKRVPAPTPPREKTPENSPVQQTPQEQSPQQQTPRQQSRPDVKGEAYDTTSDTIRSALRIGIAERVLKTFLTKSPTHGQGNPAQAARNTTEPSNRLAVDLEDVHFLTPLDGWVVGARGTIAHTEDGGASWIVQYSAPGTRFTQVSFESRPEGGVVTDSGVPRATSDGGKTWSVRPEWGRIRSLEGVDSSFGLATRPDGTLLTVTPDGEFTPVTPRPEVSLDQLSFIDSLQGWATDNAGRLWSTVNGGRAWAPVDSVGEDRFASIGFASSRVGWGVTPTGMLRRTDDGGRNWHTSLGRARLRSVAFRTDREGWAVGDGGLLLHTSDGGKSWASSHIPGAFTLRLVRFERPDSGFIVDSVGRSWRFLPGRSPGESWVSDSLAAPRGEGLQSFSRFDSEVFRSLFRLDSLTVFRVSSDGTVQRSWNAGRTWAPMNGATRARIRSMSFDQQGVGWGVSAGGALLVSRDYGASWSDPAPYSRGPAPWYWLSFVLVGALLAPVVRKPRPPPPKESVADLLVSDRPIRRGDPDALDLSSVALGLSRFIRNVKTEPPLTIAVTGLWGTGKSSLLNLLQDDLRQYGFRPIWFNAWHHQKEEHLLASLLQRVQTQAVPPLFHRNGLKFRARLLWYRAKRFRVMAALATVALVASLGYLSSDWGEQPRRLGAAISALAGDIASALKGESESTDKPGATTPPKPPTADSVSTQEEKTATKEQKGSLAALLLLVSGLASLWKGLRAFGGVPATLMTSVRGAFKLKDLKAQTSFRSQFETEFSEVTRALGAAQMVILIDDLDRCKPENVLEVLEAINFLVSSGDCFVVLAMDRDFVAGCVGIGFKHVAEELAEFNEPGEKAAEGSDPDAAFGNGTETNAKEPDRSDAAARGRQIRRTFALQYLEKLINIEVPVPSASATQLGKIISRPADVTDLLDRRRKRRRRIALAGRTALLLLATGGLISLFQWSRQKGLQDMVTGDPASAAQVPNNLASHEAPVPPATAPAAEPDVIGPPGDFVPAEEASPSRLLLLISLILLSGAGLVAILRQPAVTVHDSESFTDALNVWSPFLYSKRKTPRAMKRFLNQVRLYAMRQQAHAPPDTLWDRLCAWLGDWPLLTKGIRYVRGTDIADQLARLDDSAASNRDADEKTIPDAVLVALSSIRECRDEWLQDSRLFADFPEFLKEKDAQEPLPESVERRLADFRRWGPLTGYQERFLRLSEITRPV